MARVSRKDDILQAALACITEFGIDGTTVEMIRERSGASIGSLYHHFGNKERILAALYISGVSHYSALLEARLLQVENAEGWIKTLVSSYIDWVVENPDWARFILQSRGRIESSEQGDELRESNRQRYTRIFSTIAEYCQQGAFKAMPNDCFLSIVLGPCHDYARHWLAGRTKVALLECRELLADVAWQSVRA